MKNIYTHWIGVILFICVIFIGCFVSAQPALDSSKKSKTGNIKQAAATQLTKDSAEPTETAKSVSENSEKRLMFYISETIGFYKQVITLLLFVVTFVLAVGYYFSTKKAEELANDALKGEHFKLVLEALVNKQVTNLINNSEMATSQATLSEMNKRLVGLEKLISDKSYKIVDNEEGGDE